MNLRSKLPDARTTIFTVISRRANQCGALNIGQGFPDFPADPRLIDKVAEAMREGHNQYAMGDGVLPLREQIALKLGTSYGIEVDPLEEITVTCGGTEALFSSIQAFVGQGDEVIVFEPAYDAYEPAVKLAGGRCVRIPVLPPQFRIDWDQVRAAMTPRTRLVILNNPHNPACVVHGAAELDRLAELIRDRDIFVLSDEVYEHVLFDGARHATVLAHPELRARSLAVFSFGKTLHVTGWRAGYCVAPPALTQEFRKVHQFNTFSITSPIQYGIARYLAEHPESWQELGVFFQGKRDRFNALLQGSGFRVLPAQGSYFELLDFSDLSGESDVDFVERLIRDGGVAPIPLSPFYQSRPALSLLRVCIAKRDETLALAAERLHAFARQPVNA